MASRRSKSRAGGSVSDPQRRGMWSAATTDHRAGAPDARHTGGASARCFLFAPDTPLAPSHAPRDSAPRLFAEVELSAIYASGQHFDRRQTFASPPISVRRSISGVMREARMAQGPFASRQSASAWRKRKDHRIDLFRPVFIGSGDAAVASGVVPTSIIREKDCMACVAGSAGGTSPASMSASEK